MLTPLTALLATGDCVGRAVLEPVGPGTPAPLELNGGGVAAVDWANQPPPSEPSFNDTVGSDAASD